MKRSKNDLFWKKFEKAYEFFGRGELAKARRSYERAAAPGNTAALVNLGNYYDDATFGARNRIRAIMLYKKAVARGFLKEDTRSHSFTGLMAKRDGTVIGSRELRRWVIQMRRLSCVRLSNRAFA